MSISTRSSMWYLLSINTYDSLKTVLSISVSVHIWNINAVLHDANCSGLRLKQGLYWFSAYNHVILKKSFNLSEPYFSQGEPIRIQPCSRPI